MSQHEEEYNERFIEQLAGSYGQIEAALGSEGYKTFLDSHRANAAHVKAHSDQMRAWTGLIHMGTLSVLLSAMPVIVWLWKWAITS